MLISDDEQKRAQAPSKLYPHPANNGRTYDKAVLGAENSTLPANIVALKWQYLIFAGILLSLPYIVFDAGLTLYSATTTRTEAGQMGMLSVIYLILVTFLVWSSYKYIKSKLNGFIVSSSAIYWMVLIFTVPTVVACRLLFSTQQNESIYSQLTNAPLYYFISLVIFIASTSVIGYLSRERQGNEMFSMKAILLFISLPYIFGLLVALWSAIK